MKQEQEGNQLLNLGARIRDLRIQKSLTQLEAAERCGVDRNYIGMLERGERNPSYLTLVKIAQGLNVSLSNLLKF